MSKSVAERSVEKGKKNKKINFQKGERNLKKHIKNLEEQKSIKKIKFKKSLTKK